MYENSRALELDEIKNQLALERKKFKQTIMFLFAPFITVVLALILITSQKFFDAQNRLFQIESQTNLLYDRVKDIENEITILRKELFDIDKNSRVIGYNKLDTNNIKSNVEASLKGN